MHERKKKIKWCDAKGGRGGAGSKQGGAENKNKQMGHRESKGVLGLLGWSGLSEPDQFKGEYKTGEGPVFLSFSSSHSLSSLKSLSVLSLRVLHFPTIFRRAYEGRRGRRPEAEAPPRRIKKKPFLNFF